MDWDNASQWTGTMRPNGLGQCVPFHIHRVLTESTSRDYSMEREKGNKIVFSY